MNSWINLHALWKIVVVGLAAGAGLPALFAIGLRALSTGPETVTVNGVEDDRIFGGSVPGLILAIVCFAAVLSAIGWGINSVVSGA